jgi:hypothetical protein
MDKDIFMFGDGGSKGSDIMAMIPALMQNKGMDPNLVAALMNGNNNRNGFGGDDAGGSGLSCCSSAGAASAATVLATMALTVFRHNLTTMRVVNC